MPALAIKNSIEELAMSISKKGPLPVAKPEEMGLSSKGLARIGPAMQKYIDRKMVPMLRPW